jgi:hypothetical protein
LLFLTLAACHWTVGDGGTSRHGVNTFDQHPTADVLLDYATGLTRRVPHGGTASASPGSQGGVPITSPENPSVEALAESANAHLLTCVYCRLHVNRLTEVGQVELPDGEAVTELAARAPVLAPDVMTALFAEPTELPAPGDIWRVGYRDAHLVWVRKRVGATSLDVIPVTFDTDMADNTSLLLRADATPFGLPLIAFVALRTHIHLEACMSRVGSAVEIAAAVEAIQVSIRTGQECHVLDTGTRIVDDNDPRLEYQDTIRDQMSALAPSLWQTVH